jgi:hypothetical protein
MTLDDDQRMTPTPGAAGRGHTRKADHLGVKSTGNYIRLTETMESRSNGQPHDLGHLSRFAAIIRCRTDSPSPFAGVKYAVRVSRRERLMVHRAYLSLREAADELDVERWKLARLGLWSGEKCIPVREVRQAKEEVDPEKRVAVIRQWLLQKQC